MRTILAAFGFAVVSTFAAELCGAGPDASDEQSYMITIRYMESAAAKADDPAAGGIAVLSNDDVAALMKARHNDKSFKILCAPKVVTRNDLEATVQVGGEREFTIDYDAAGPVKKTFKIGTHIAVKPTALDDGRVRVAVALEDSTLRAISTFVVEQPGTGTKRKVEVPEVKKGALNTTVDLQEGQFVLVSGSVAAHNGRLRRNEMLVTVERFTEAQ